LARAGDHKDGWRAAKNASGECPRTQPRDDMPHRNREYGITDRQYCECETQPNQMEISQLGLLCKVLRFVKC
jgi:hypothetical protein